MAYIQTLDDQQARPPYICADMVARVFLLVADQAKLQQYCDTFLNIFGDPFFYAPTPFVYLSLVTYPDMRVGGEENDGSTHQNEYFVMFPVIRCASWGPILVPVELTWAFPFIGVDNSTSAIAGQAVVGFAKTCGTIDIATSPTGAVTGNVAMPGFATLSKTSKQELLPIVSITTGQPLDPATMPAPGPSGLATLTGALLDNLVTADQPLLELIEELAVDLSGLSITTLKQIRSATDPFEAEVQHLVRGDWGLANFHDWTLWDGAEIVITDNATTKIVETLGLGASGVPLQALSALAVTCNMTLGNFTQ